MLEKFPGNIRAKKGYLLSQSAFADANFSSTHPAMKELDDIARALSLGEAETAARRAYALAPKFSDAHGLFNLLGVAAAATKREEDAVKAFKRAIYLKPDFMEARANLASRMMAGSDFETALRVIEESLELAPGDALALNAMTVCLIGLKRFGTLSDQDTRRSPPSLTTPRRTIISASVSGDSRNGRRRQAASRAHSRSIRISPMP